MRTIVLRNGTNFTPSEETKTEFRSTIGYLTQWQLSTHLYGHVELSIHSNGDMAAAYWTSIEDDVLSLAPKAFLFAERREDGSYRLRS
jgi:hypothetical protein